MVTFDVAFVQPKFNPSKECNAFIFLTKHDGESPE